MRSQCFTHVRLDNLSCPLTVFLNSYLRFVDTISYQVRWSQPHSENDDRRCIGVRTPHMLRFVINTFTLRLLTNVQHVDRLIESDRTPHGSDLFGNVFGKSYWQIRRTLAGTLRN